MSPSLHLTHSRCPWSGQTQNSEVHLQSSSPILKVGRGGGGRRHLTQSVGHLPFTCLLLIGTALLANRCPLLSLSSWPLLTPLCCHSAGCSSCCCSLHLPLAYDGFDSGSNLVISALIAFSSWPKAQSSHKKIPASTGVHLYTKESPYGAFL